MRESNMICPQCGNKMDCIPNKNHEIEWVCWECMQEISESEYRAGLDFDEDELDDGRELI